MKNFAKKRLGQHFLIDTGVVERILDCIRPTQNDVIIEIGAGNGVLSAPLSSRVASLLAIEIDPDCLPSLNHAVEKSPQAEVILADILEVDIESLVAPHITVNRRLRLCGNLPYNIATAIIARLFGLNLPVADMIFMVQLEVAQRITASARSRQYGYFSVLCQHYCQTSLCFKVSPAAFKPRPRVYSALIRLVPRGLIAHPEMDNALITVTKAAFAHRRKKIANALRLHPMIGTASESILASARINGSLRAEQLSIQEYELLGKIFYKHLIGNDLQNPD